MPALDTTPIRTAANALGARLKTVFDNRITIEGSGVTAGTYNNSATQIRPFTVNSKGQITSVGAAVTLTPAWSNVTGKPTTLSGYGIVDAVTKGTEVSIANGIITSATLDTTTAAPLQVVDSFDAAVYRCAKYLIQATSGSAFQVAEVLMIHDGTNVYLTEYGNVMSGARLVTMDGSIVGGQVQLLANPMNASTSIKVVRTSIVL